MLCVCHRIWPTSKSKFSFYRLVTVGRIEPRTITHDRYRFCGVRPYSAAHKKGVTFTRPENMASDLESLSHTELLARCERLEEQLVSQTARIAELTSAACKVNSRAPSPKTVLKAPARKFDVTRHSTRFIALKFSYLGHNYNGFEHANRCFTPLPTIEEVLWKALRKARLIDPPIPEGADTSYEVVFDPKAREKKYHIHGKPRQDEKERLELSWEGCQYSKCGRTDRGVSAFGQVIGIRVRSNAPVPKTKSSIDDQDLSTEQERQKESGVEEEIQNLGLHDSVAGFDPITDELPYVYMLNMLLPPDIRILAWAPSPPEGFDARYSCLERRYKYLFTNPAFCPTPGPTGLTHASGQDSAVREGWLDIGKMKEAAKKLEGLHDYRNLCVIDASKQMPNCQRRIAFADIEEFEGTPFRLAQNPHFNQFGEKVAASDGSGPATDPKVYAIVIHGSAFLYHQVRCTAAILFLVGQGLESPDVVDRLLDIEKTPGRPHYNMADDAPLVLWDCVFPFDDTESKKGLDWVYAGDKTGMQTTTSKGDGRFGPGGVIETLFEQWQEAKLKEAQVGALLSMALDQGDQSSIQRGGFRDPSAIKSRSQKMFEGTGKARLAGKYQPLLSRPTMDTLEVLNARYLNTVKGQRRQAIRNGAASTD